jgi:hypothetical protein
MRAGSILDLPSVPCSSRDRLRGASSKLSNRERSPPASTIPRIRIRFSALEKPMLSPKIGNLTNGNELLSPPAGAVKWTDQQEESENCRAEFGPHQVAV